MARRAAPAGERTLETTAVAAGGDAIARDRDGRVVFVEGALPGEVVRATLVDERRDFARARVVDVLAASPDRVAPSCPAVTAGCGGCQWQHVRVDAQRRLKADIVRDALRRIARLPEPPVEDDVWGVPADAYRTTLSLAVRGGRVAYRRRHTAELVEVAGCGVAHPLLAEIVAGGRFPGAAEVVLRAGAATGQRLALVRPRAAAGVRVPDGTAVVSGDDARAVAGSAVEEVVAGRRWRVSATSFFQSGPDAAELLVAAVGEAAGPALSAGALLVDAYAGVGLLGGALAARSGARLVAVESNRAAVRDARHNLRDLDAEVVEREVARWRAPSGAAVVLADPARPGLGPSAVRSVVGAARLVLVSCDPASLARDAALLGASGYRLRGVRVLDLFPHTVHVEAVSTFESTAAAALEE